MVKINTVAVISPGDMGHAVGQSLLEHGLDVITCLVGRSTRTQNLSRQANIREVATLEDLVTQADLILSILVPSEALRVAIEMGKALLNTGANTYFVDCNAISPQKTLELESVISDSGGRYIDASIIGSPPGRQQPPRFYVSGAHHQAMTQLNDMGISIRTLGDEVGKASGIKMCYAGLTKGTTALHVALLTAAEVSGLAEDLFMELKYSQSNTLKEMEARIPRIPANAFRWIGEMDEIADTYSHLGVTPNFHRGAADVYQLLSQTPYASENAESIDPNRTLRETIQALVPLLPLPPDESG